MLRMHVYEITQLGREAYTLLAIEALRQQNISINPVLF